VDTKKLEKIINYGFTKEDLLLEALTHRSYLNENTAWHLPHNERLEFLGDAVLELVVTEELYAAYPEYNEGQLTLFRASLVNYQMLAEISREIALEDFLLLSKGEAKDMGRARDVILANAMESLIGAMYLDGGYPAAKVFINEFIMPHLKEVIEKESYRDAKSMLQEKTQARFKQTPLYKVLGETGPDHKKLFVSGAYIGEKLIAEGKGYSKQDAELDAAKKALEELK